MSYVQSASPPQTAVMLDSFYYSVAGEDPDMLSLGFVVEPVVRQPEDRHGLLPALPVRGAADEIGLGIRMLEATSRLVDLDEMLASDADLREHMIVESLVLLGHANYPVDDGGRIYREWLARRREGEQA